jgi:hypothetical protein
MRVALATLCIVAVTFLLSVLASLANEWMSFRRGERRGELRDEVARFGVSRQRGELIEINSELRKPKTPPRTGERIAL